MNKAERKSQIILLFEAHMERIAKDLREQEAICKWKESLRSGLQPRINISGQDRNGEQISQCENLHNSFKED